MCGSHGTKSCVLYMAIHGIYYSETECDSENNKDIKPDTKLLKEDSGGSKGS